MMGEPRSRSPRRSPRLFVVPSTFLSFFLLIVIATASTVVKAQGGHRSHDRGLWGSAKDAVEPIVRPVFDSICSKYDGLNDNGRFLAGACVGFGASKFAVGTTVKALKTIGVAYIVLEGLEYAGILKDARRSAKNRHALARTRDYVLRTVDEIRHDVRTQMNPAGLRKKWTGSMEQDKPGTVGFATGAFLGFVL